MLNAELDNAISSGRVSHAYIFTDESMAMEFADSLNCKAVDFIVVEKASGKAHILVEDIENLQEQIKYKPYGSIRVSVIKEADSMFPQAQNKLLKTLEEPPEGNVLILIAANLEALLPTVLSRCIKVKSDAVYSSEDKRAAEMAEAFYGAQRKGAYFYQLKETISPLLDPKESSRDLALSFIDKLEDLYRIELENTLNAGLKKELEGLQHVRTNIKQGLSAGYALKAFCLSMEVK